MHDFFKYLSYLNSLDVWSALKSAMKYFEDVEMMKLIERMETAYLDMSESSTEELKEIDMIYFEILPTTIKRIGDFIRNNPAEFTNA